jgi:hypothetical protein
MEGASNVCRKKQVSFRRKLMVKNCMDAIFFPTAPPIPAVLAFAKEIHAKHAPPEPKDKVLRKPGS